MKCLWHYEWVRLSRNIVPEGKGILGDWARLKWYTKVVTGVANEI